MKLTIHRGTHEIGGNCVELCTDSTRIVVDVGMPLADKNGQAFDSRTLEGRNTDQLLQQGVLPPVPGLFAKDPTSTPAAIIISHAHSDHTGLLRFTRPEIPVWLSRGTSDMMYVALKFARQHGVSCIRQQVFTAGRSFQVGDFQITAFPVDHSAFDSMAFLIEADGKRVLYSGDLRLHGRKPGMARALIEAVGGSGIDVLLMEGTHIGHASRPRKTETDLEDEIVPLIEKAPGLVVACFSPLHIDRLVTFLKATVRAGRCFVVDPYAGLAMNKAASHCQLPDPAKDQSIRVYFNHDFERSYEAKNLGHVRQMLESNRICLDEIRSSPRAYLQVFRPRMAEVDFGGVLPEKSRCLYSYWAGYLEQPVWTEFQERLTEVQGDFIKAHTSGHITSDDIVSFIKAIAPATVVPIHTFEPNQFADFCPSVRCVNDGEVFELTD